VFRQYFDDSALTYENSFRFSAAESARRRFGMDAAKLWATARWSRGSSLKDPTMNTSNLTQIAASFVGAVIAAAVLVAAAVGPAVQIV
jgi:hypothetical protein